jgi:hypothetical protein
MVVVNSVVPVRRYYDYDGGILMALAVVAAVGGYYD